VLADGVSIEPVTELTESLVTALGRLLPQLSERAVHDRATLQAVVDSPATTLFVATSGGEVLGMCTIAIFTIPTGVRAWIEDVVVDDRARGMGLGAALVDESVKLAKAVGARSVDLTSRPDRAAANRLYQRCGFEQRTTNVYRKSLDSPGT
jgi:ribosomal protein S18 acetylase RimI-like enzyme